MVTGVPFRQSFGLQTFVPAADTALQNPDGTGPGISGVGMFGVLTFEVAQRRHELGIRMALGAPVRRVLRRVLFAGTGTVVLGATVGLALATVAAPRIAPLLFQTAPRDPAVFGVAAGVLVVVGLIASWAPAWRATRVAPTEAMRDR